jgi:preprotein translocase subunit SecF
LSAFLPKRRFAPLIAIVALGVAAVGIYFGRGSDCAIDKSGTKFALQSTEPIDIPELQAFLATAGIAGISIGQTSDPAAVVLSSAGKTWGDDAILSLQAALKDFGDVQIARTELIGAAGGCPR